MILGIDHIALSCTSIEPACETMVATGYSKVFIESELLNAPEKMRFLRNPRSDHSIAYCRAPAGPAFELTRHADHYGEHHGPYEVLMSGPPPQYGDTVSDPILESLWQDAMGIEAKRLKWEPFAADIWCSTPPLDSRYAAVPAILLAVHDLTLSRDFWCNGLGCREIKSGTVDTHDWLLISFASPVPTWRLKVILLEKPPQPATSYMDDCGFPCLAVISNRLTADRENLIKCGAIDVGNEFSFAAGGRELGICILRGPDSELIEVIEIAKG